MVIGITGPSGAGKSELALLFRKTHQIIDADQVYYDLMSTELGADMQARLLLEFGTLDRRELRKIAFSDDKHELINSITHPYVLAEIKKRLTPNCIIDAPLLFESNADSICDITIAVVANNANLVQRIVARDKLDKKDAKQRLQAQKDANWYARRATYIILNNDKREELLIQWETINRKLQSMEEHLTLQRSAI